MKNKSEDEKKQWDNDVQILFTQKVIFHDWFYHILYLHP